MICEIDIYIWDSWIKRNYVLVIHRKRETVKQLITTPVPQGSVFNITQTVLPRCTLGDLDLILKVKVSNSFLDLLSWVILAKWLSELYHRIPAMISQQWLRSWFGAVRPQAVTWTNVDPDLCRHTASLGHTDLNKVENAAYVFLKLLYCFDICQTSPWHNHTARKTTKFQRDNKIPHTCRAFEMFRDLIKYISLLKRSQVLFSWKIAWGHDKDPCWHFERRCNSLRLRASLHVHSIVIFMWTKIPFEIESDVFTKMMLHPWTGPTANECSIAYPHCKI